MERKELYEALVKSGQYQTNRSSELWIKVIEAYKKATGDYQVSLECGSCFKKLRQWLEK